MKGKIPQVPRFIEIIEGLGLLPYPVPEWFNLDNIEELNCRGDNRVEWVCKHGVGHTVQGPTDNFVHGCDLCCNKLIKKCRLKGEIVKVETKDIDNKTVQVFYQLV